MNRHFVALLVALSIVSSQATCFATPSKPSPLTRKAVTLFQQGKLLEALEVGYRAITKKPDDWLSQALFSYLAWQQGNVMAALESGHKALELSPDSPVVLTNLAKMEEWADHCDAAISLYEKALKLQPDAWLPRLGIARCHIKMERLSDGLTILEEMAAQTKDDFQWYQETGDLYLSIDKPKPAAECFSKAMKLATTPEQKSDSASQLMIALLIDKQFDRAGAMMGLVYRECQPRDYEFFVRTSQALLPADDPASAKVLVESALKNLVSEEDAEGFYRLGRIFTDKAALVSDDAAKFDLWMDSAASMYRKAVELEPMQARYHLALAGILAWQGKDGRMIEELNRSRQLDTFDSLAPYLLKIASNTQDNATGDVSNLNAKTVRDLNLKQINCKFNGLTCNCHVAKVRSALSNIDGVAFADVESAKPYPGTLLVDESRTSLSKLTSELNEAFAPGADPKLTIEVVSSSNVKGAEEAVRVTQKAVDGDVLEFDHQFKPVEPTMPVTLTDKRAISLN